MPVTLTCNVCGSAFTVKPYKAETAKYCSHECRLTGLHQKIKEDRPKAEHVCQQCGVTFKRSPTGKPKYCTRACYDVAQKNDAAAVFDRVDKSGGDASCWPWTGPVTVWGYGRATRNHRTHNAHRMAFEATYGPVPDGMVVLHSCDNRTCCNPAHLSAGTQRDNMADMVAKGRARWQKTHS